MTPALALALAELRILSRDRVAAFNVVVIPLVGAIYLATNPPPTQDIPGSLAASAAAVLLALFTGAALVLKSVMTLAQRREQHLLERWRTSGAGPTAILAGTLAPGALLLVAGTAMMFPVLAFVLEDAPVQPVWLVVAVVLAGALGGAAAVLAAAFTRSSDAAPIVVLPIFAALFGGGIWASVVPLGEISWRMRVTGGGALTELVRLGWEGAPGGGGAAASVTTAGPSLLVLLGLTAALAAVAARTFRWTPRR